MSTVRVCRKPSCHTILSRFNHDVRCWQHQDYALPQRHQVHNGQGVMSSRFLTGIPETLNGFERESLRTGAWIESERSKE